LLQHFKVEFYLCSSAGLPEFAVALNQALRSSASSADFCQCVLLVFHAELHSANLEKLYIHPSCLFNFARQRIDAHYALQLIAKKFHAVSSFFAGRKNIYNIAAYAEGAAVKIYVVSLVLNISQLAQQFIAHTPLASF
jgi:hypothetical protein